MTGTHVSITHSRVGSSAGPDMPYRIPVGHTGRDGRSYIPIIGNHTPVPATHLDTPPSEVPPSVKSTYDRASPYIPIIGNHISPHPHPDS